MMATDVRGLLELAGTHLGYTDWEEMTQQRVDRFADVTGDHQFIHVDPERAKATPFGGEIASATEVAGGVQVKVIVSVEVEGAAKPALVAEALSRHYA